MYRQGQEEQNNTCNLIKSRVYGYQRFSSQQTPEDIAQFDDLVNSFSDEEYEQVNYLYDLIKNEFHVLVSPHSFNTLNGLLKTINKSLMPYHDFFIAEIGVDCKNGMEKYLKVFNFYISAV